MTLASAGGTFPGKSGGMTPVARVVVMENHDQAYYTWRDAGVKQKILIHIDAHHDMWWMRESSPITIANFICPALKEELVREVYWVVPDATWQTARSRKPIVRHLRRITQAYPSSSDRLSGGLGNWWRSGRHIDAGNTSVLGKPLRVCPLNSLPRFSEDVLLDIDVDFLVIPRVSYGQSDEHGPLPWCWPEELLARLAASGIRSDLATVVYSVEGGYTPLKWKYLGDELALRLQNDGGGASLRGMALIREGAVAAVRAELVLAEERFRAAVDLLPNHAAPCYHLAHLYAAIGRIDEGRKLYQQALTVDCSYRTPYNSGGLQYFEDGDFAAAEREHRSVLAVDPDDAYAHYGLGRLAVRKKRWSEAETLLRKALAIKTDLTDAYRALGEVLERQQRIDEAITAYKQSLKLALAGHKPVTDSIATHPPSALYHDPEHFAVHARLARLHERKGATAEAIAGYRMSIAAGYDGVLVRCRLLRLYVKQKQWRKAGWEAWRVPMVGLWNFWQAVRDRLRRWGIRLKETAEVSRVPRGIAGSVKGCP